MEVEAHQILDIIAKLLQRLDKRLKAVRLPSLSKAWR